MIDQVKDEYAQLADMEGSSKSTARQLDAPTPEAYYEGLLAQVIAGIEAGRFDAFHNGRDIVEAVANNKKGWGITM